MTTTTTSLLADQPHHLRQQQQQRVSGPTTASSTAVTPDEQQQQQRSDTSASPHQLTETGTESTSADDWLLEDIDQISVRTQTLEEIMAEKDTDFLFFASDDEELLQLLNGTNAVGSDDRAESPSLAQFVAGVPPIAPMGRYGATATELPNSYSLDSPLLVKRADAISHQIASVHERPTDAGRPTVLCVGRQLIAVGTARGLCLLFERGTQRLRRFMRAEHAFGSVSCLDFSLDPQQQRLCAGFSSGALTVFDCGRGRVLFSGDDLIQPGRSVLHVKYIAGNVLLIVDSGGNVYEFHERHQQAPQRRNEEGGGATAKNRTKRRRNAVRCLFAGCKGEVTNICFVHTAEVELLVLATFTQVLLLSTKRRGAPIGHLRLHGSPLHPPVIDWRERRMSMSGGAMVRDLWLCIGRDCELRVHQVRQRVGGDLLFPLVGVVRTEQPLLGLKWLDNWALLTIVGDAGKEQLQVLELHHAQNNRQQQHQQRRGGGTHNQKELGATLTASAELGTTVQLLYNSADFKGLATGRNVSEAMSKLADLVCLHSVSRPPPVDGTEDKQQPQLLYLLGRNGLFGVQLMDQVEQLDALVAKDDFVSALLYAVDVCNGRVRDRSRHGDFRAKASHAVPRLVTRLLDRTIDGLDSGRIDELVAHYKRNIHVLVRACISTSHFELLYDTVYGQLQRDSLCRPIFLELLEEFVFDAQLDRPPPGLVNDYLSYLLTEGQLPQFEQSVTRLPVDCMDLHQVMTTCLQHRLFDGLCHVMNNAMRDYIGPLKEMCEHMRHIVRKEVLSDCDIAQGNKLLLYLSCCLAGRAYPYGELPDEHLAKTVPLETYKFLVQLRPKFVAGPPSSTEESSPSPPTISKEADDDGRNNNNNNNNNGGGSGGAPFYTGDAPATNDKSILFSASFGVDNSSNTAYRSPMADLRFPHLQLMLKLDPQQFLNVINTCADASVFATVEGRLKRLVDVLVAMCVEKGEDERNELGPLLVAFVVGLLQKGSIPKDVFILTQLIKRVLQRQFLNVRAQKQAEQYIVDLLRMVPEIDMDNVLDIAQRRPYVHVCAYIFTVRKQYVQLLECCLGDFFEPKNVFYILADLLTNLRDNAQLTELRQFVHARLDRLSNLDPQLAAHLVMNHLPELLVEVRSNPRKLPFQLVRQCFALRRHQGHRTLSGGYDDFEQDEQLFGYLFGGIIDAYDNNGTGTVGSEEENVVENKCDAASLATLDNELADLLRYWLPLGAATDHCLNVAMQWKQKQQRMPNADSGAAVLLLTIPLLLVARGHTQRAFEHIFLEGIGQRMVAATGDGGDQNNSLDDRCVGSLLELAAAHPADARHGDWLAKLFRHLLKALPSAPPNTTNEATTDEAAVKSQQEQQLMLLLRPNTHLCRVLNAIIEQQHHHEDETEGEGEQLMMWQRQNQHKDNNQAGEDDTPAPVLVAELFSHPRFQHAPLHIFHRLLRHMLLCCEIRVLMERATRDCARHELASQFEHNKLGLGKRPAFAIQRGTAHECAADNGMAMMAPVGAAAVDQPTAESLLVVPVGHCLWCGRRIAKSFHLFPCGHTLHLECVEQQHQLLQQQQQQQQQQQATPTTTGATQIGCSSLPPLTTTTKSRHHRQRHRFCPCNAQQHNDVVGISNWRKKWSDNRKQDDDDLPVAERADELGGDAGAGGVLPSTSAAALSASSAGTDSRRMALAVSNGTRIGTNRRHANGQQEMDERRTASAVFRRLEQDFPICTGPPPPSKTANEPFHHHHPPHTQHQLSSSPSSLS